MLAGRTGVGQHEGPHGSVRLSPGVVQLVSRDEARAERARATHRLKSGPTYLHHVEGVGYVNRRTGEVFDEIDVMPVRRRSRIDSWSPKSRANMVRVMASADWRPLFRCGPGVMVTLTYPGPWFMLAPSRAVVAKHLEAFKERYRRAFGSVLGAWKIEYQGRGAPHLHLFLPMPWGHSLGSFRDWVRRAWHSVVWNDRGDRVLELATTLVGAGEALAFVSMHSARHLAAGANVDQREGERCRDPRRLAVYFLGHSMKHKDGKEYQHQLPPSYAGAAGRWWGIWGVECVVGIRYLDVRSWILLRRFLRRWAKANNRRAFRGGRMYGGWVSVNDGPAFLSQLARALALD